MGACNRHPRALPGDIISVEVEEHHTYFADGILTHNSFAGAVNAMSNVGSDSLEGRLTQSWRFGPDVADAANNLLAELGDDMRLTGNPSIESVVTGSHPADVVLTRTNGVALEHVIAAQTAGRKVHLMGDQQYAVKFCEAAQKLMNGDRAGHEDLAVFPSWSAVQEFAEDAPGASDWKTLVDLIDSNGVDAILDALGSLVDEQQAQHIDPPGLNGSNRGAHTRTGIFRGGGSACSNAIRTVARPTWCRRASSRIDNPGSRRRW